MNKIGRGLVRNPLESGPLVDHLSNEALKKVANQTGGFGFSAAPGPSAATTTQDTDGDGKIFTVDIALYDIDNYDDPAAVYYSG